MTEFMGRMIIENTLYQGLASMIFRECRIQMIMKGIQQRKSVAIMMLIFLFILLFLLVACDWSKLLEDLEETKAIRMYDTDMKRKHRKFIVKMVQTKYL
jgi:Ca2+/Na+ antiporter